MPASNLQQTSKVERPNFSIKSVLGCMWARQAKRLDHIASDTVANQGKWEVRRLKILFLLRLSGLRPDVGTACLRLGADHERVAPHGLRLLGTLILLLSARHMEGPGPNAVVLDAFWLPDASRMLVAGLQSSSMKVSSLIMLRGLAAVASPRKAIQPLRSALEQMWATGL